MIKTAIKIASFLTVVALLATVPLGDSCILPANSCGMIELPNGLAQNGILKAVGNTGALVFETTTNVVAAAWNALMSGGAGAT